MNLEELTPMSDTPRTDAKECTIGREFVTVRVVDSAFARQLERELAHAHKLVGEAAEIRAENVRLKNQIENLLKPMRDSAVQSAKDHAFNAAKAAREREEWRSVAEKLAKSYRENNIHGISNALAEFNKLKGTTP